MADLCIEMLERNFRAIFERLDDTTRILEEISARLQHVDEGMNLAARQIAVLSRRLDHSAARLDRINDRLDARAELEAR